MKNFGSSTTGAIVGKFPQAFFVALGALRAVIGYQVAQLAAHYDIDVEGDLAAMLPNVEEDGS